MVHMVYVTTLYCHHMVYVTHGGVCDHMYVTTLYYHHMVYVTHCM